jgi:hypothetical protein
VLDIVKILTDAGADRIELLLEAGCGANDRNSMGSMVEIARLLEGAISSG